MDAVTHAVIRLGHEPLDVSAENVGWDIESRDPKTGELRLIEVKGRRAGADSVFITKNEMNYARNNPEHYILALVLVDGENVDGPWYARNIPFQEPSFTQTGSTHSISKILAMAEKVVQ
jgi:hypothetical protein